MLLCREIRERESCSLCLQFTREREINIFIMVDTFFIIVPLKIKENLGRIVAQTFVEKTCLFI